MKRAFAIGILTAAFVSLAAGGLGADDISGSDVQFFESHVRPLLIKYCYECHSKGAEKVKAGLFLDSRDGWAVGGDSGPAIVPGDVERSLLLRAVRHEIEGVEMPPQGRLGDEEIAVLQAWVERGAPDPRTGQTVTRVAQGVDVEAGRAFWSFQALQAHKPPAVRDGGWPRGVIDRFILARLESQGLEPVHDADSHTLIRRLTFDLTGLPPMPEDVEAFVEAFEMDPQAAVEAAVDRLLASPAFGERWGRHWLDVARYADSNGGGVNFTYDNAWRYRDYVIAAFNDDKPYDVFVREQVAGDLLPHESPRQRAERVIATGFLLVGPKPLAKYDKEALKLDVVDEQIDTVGRAFLGLTLGCARCHDHKFDPVAMEDYYALAGMFTSTLSIPDGGRRGPISTWNKVPIPIKENDQPWFAARKGQLGKPLALAVEDVKKPRDEHVRIRGLSGSKGKRVERGVLPVATRGEPPTIPDDASGRRELAMWLTDARQGAGALTARVMVNRVWHHLLGRGIVGSVDNFGQRGQRPSHPELLETLAAEFVAEGWSMKNLIRRMATSRTYRLAAAPTAESAASRAQSRDPANHLFWRANGRRLDVEAIRDAILTVSGALDPNRGGPTLTYSGRLNAPGNYKKLDVPSPMHRRGVYLPILRDGMSMMDSMDMLETFDFADPSMVTGDRASTTVPTQALFLMNSPFVMQQARRTAAKLLEREGDDAARVQRLFQRALARPATEAEVAGALQLIGAFIKAGEGDENDRRLAAWSALCQSVFACNEFLFLN